MPACFIASGLSPNLSTIERNLWGNIVPESWQILAICFPFVTGIIPASTGVVIPASLIWYK